MPGFWLFPLCYQIISISWGPTYVPQIQTNAFDDYKLNVTALRKHEEQARFSPLRRLTTCITGCSLGLSEFLHKITNMILLCFHSPCFKKSEACLRSSETGGSLVILILAPSTNHTSAGNRRFIGLASSGPSGRRAIPVRILVMASNLGGALQNFGSHDIPRHTPDGSELSTFFLDPRRPLHPLHQSFTYEPKQILWHLKSKPLGTAQISTAWFVAFYDP